jgi:uncharacterized membrane protein
MNKQTTSILGYFVFLVPFLSGRMRDQSVRYHAYQALGGTIVGFALQGIISVLGYWIFRLSIYSMAGIITPLVWALRFFLIYLIAMGIQNVLAGRMKPLPVIGKYSEKLSG